jgi:hypothetical protein
MRSHADLHGVDSDEGALGFAANAVTDLLDALANVLSR